MVSCRSRLGLMADSNGGFYRAGPMVHISIHSLGIVDCVKGVSKCV